MSKPYTVALRDPDALPVPLRITAEVRYAGALEFLLGSDEQVAAVYAAWIAATQAEAAFLDRESALLAARWPAAHQEALSTSLRALGHFEGEPHFDMRLARKSEAA